MESSRPKEERKTKEHITPRNGGRYEKTEQQLDKTRKEGPGHCGLENVCQRPMSNRHKYISINNNNNNNNNNNTITIM
ncbi:unnamed protein product [Schistosoma margrebowiei]|uniref:Uncharacterized protein n=1 Tax=Schistosoma margrebowiei TaxID=48269 RepID=A0A183L925_9TREM|nr:unnamed protein product [Schistosoma margrebowiei]